MRELEIKTDQVENHRGIGQEKKFKFVGKMFLKRGHSLFKFNAKTGVVELVEITKKVSINIKKEVVKEKKAMFEDNCYYISALNLKNAKKKALKIVMSFKK